MLKAYDYADLRQKKVDIQDAELFRKEKEVALKYVINHPTIQKENCCPVCGATHTRFIFSRWDVEYRFCEECYSLYIPVENEILGEYLALEDMKMLRTSDEYQKQAVARRNDIWNEQVMWAKYRIFRYLGENTDLDVIDYGNRYLHYVEKFRNSGICQNYELRDSILDIKTDKVEKADVVLYMNQLQHEMDPIKTLSQIKESLKSDGILILNTRLGSGFDILTLKGEMDSIFPYEHIMLPSRKGLEIILDKAGFELLEVTTPGTRDMDTVLNNKEKIENSNFFVKYLLQTADHSVLTDFQQFLQKSGLSSFAQVIAKVRE